MLEWLAGLPSGLLYAVLAGTAAIENLFPPFPADVAVAFGSFVVAQSDRGSLLVVFLVTWFGNVSGAMLVYLLGRRYGAERLQHRLGGKRGESWEAQFHALFDRFGMPAIFVSRFVPGVRAIVPAFAGALRLSVFRTLLMISLASAIWYGLITVVAFRVGSDWERLSATIARYGATAGVVGAVLLSVGIGAWFFARRRKRT